ncbi:hypothetical protein AVEN_111607-1 [Araneus ventricosus]|uniref:Uncharacterized protein n=1 Tax=Araneus ventricosus TaxID=182803 RepID=A0A4Y2C2D1_ARAVE|nr:hypothetical protein AVEN_111607-1 [Araneus ventricosus]
MSLRTSKKTRGGPRWSIWRRASAGDGWDWRSTSSNSDDEEEYSYTRVASTYANKFNCIRIFLYLEGAVMPPGIEVWIRKWRIAESRPDSTEEPQCMQICCTIFCRGGSKVLILVWRGSLGKRLPV